MSSATINPDPITLIVPLGQLRETDLVAALDFVMGHWQLHCSDMDSFEGEARRAAAWLNDKYGQRVALLRVGEER